MDLFFCLQVNLFLFLCNMTNAESEKQCPKTFNLRNGKVRFQLRGGVTAVFTCDVGFTLRGSNVSHCQTDGHWSAATPNCVPNDQRCIASEMETISLKSGKTINVSCSKDPSVEDSHHFWTTNGTIVVTTFIKYDKLIITIKIPGLYVCLMYSASEVNILRTVKVIASDETQLQPTSEKCDLSFKNISTSIFPKFGSDLTLSCEVGSLSAKLSWLKDGKIILDENGAYSNYFLNISNFQKMDEGNYTCVAREKNFPQCFKVKSMVVKVENLSQLTSSFVCGQPVNTARRWRRVIDGSRAAPLSAPWMGMLTMDREPPFCGCSLISNKWVVTAAHCFRSANKGNSSFMSQEEIQKKVRVKFGKQQRRQIEKGEVMRNIQTVVFYPKFKLVPSVRNLANEHDIAVVKLREPVVFQTSVLPICLPPPGFMASVPTGTLGVVTGWGRVSVRDSVMAHTLQEAHLPLVNNSSCQESTNYAITDNMLCAGYAESYRPDTCSGDSGGPFVLRKLNSFYLAGVVSWGEGCSSPKKFGIYTRVENYVPWIQSVLLEKSTETL